MTQHEKELEQLDALVRAAQRLREDWNTSGMARAMARDTFMCAVAEAPIQAFGGPPVAPGEVFRRVTWHTPEHHLQYDTREPDTAILDGRRYDLSLLRALMRAVEAAR